MLLLLLHPRGARRCAQGPVLCSPVDRLGESFRFAWRRSSRRRPSRSGSVPRGSSSSAVEACSELDHGPWASTVGSVFRVWSVCSVSLSCPCGWEWGGEGGASSMNHDVFRHTFDCAAGRPACSTLLTLPPAPVTCRAALKVRPPNLVRCWEDCHGR